MKRFSLPIPSGWRNAKKLPIPTHAELVERVAVLMERVARQDVKLGRLEQKIVRWLADPLINEPNLDDFTPDGRGYMIPRAVVAHPTEADLAALEHLKTEPGVVQPLQPGDVIAPTPIEARERPWEWANWLHPEGGWCWYHQGASSCRPPRWHQLNPVVDLAVESDGWMLPHYAIPEIPAAPSPEGGQA
ncbi:MAG: hypothetical protein LW834_06715 [Cyanobium sp. 49614_E6]|jgi:hypothetical protein|nr:hypothetical protein [Cyanobium sp. 49614_E6]